VPTQCHDAATGTANIPQEELEQGTAADHLRTVGMLGPPHRVTPGGSTLPAGIGQNRLGYLHEGLLRAARDLLDHLGCVATEVAFEDLKDGGGIL
jgi:hypothetical protein